MKYPCVFGIPLNNNPEIEPPTTFYRVEIYGDTNLSRSVSRADAFRGSDHAREWYKGEFATDTLTKSPHSRR